MTIEKLMEITKSIDNKYQKFQLCKLEHNIYDSDIYSNEIYKHDFYELEFDRSRLL